MSWCRLAVAKRRRYLSTGVGRPMSAAFRAGQLIQPTPSQARLVIIVGTAALATGPSSRGQRQSRRGRATTSPCFLAIRRLTRSAAHSIAPRASINCPPKNYRKDGDSFSTDCSTSRCKRRRFPRARGVRAPMFTGIGGAQRSDYRPVRRAGGQFARELSGGLTRTSALRGSPSLCGTFLCPRPLDAGPSQLRSAPYQALEQSDAQPAR
jgi:hypothetical protein